MLEAQARIDNGQDPKSKQDISLSILFKNQNDKHKWPIHSTILKRKTYNYIRFILHQPKVLA